MKAARFLVAGILFSSNCFAQIAPIESSLRTAVAGGGTITFTGSGVIGLNAPIAVTVNTTIDAAGNDILIDGQGKTNLFTVGNGVQFTLKNLTLANGLAKGADGSRAVKYGAAIQSDGGLVVAENVVFTNNSAVGGSSTTMPFERPVSSGGEAMGGAIWQNGGSLTILGGAFLNNSVKGGAGIGYQPGRGGAVFGTGGVLSITGAAFAGNLALGGPNRDQIPGGVGAGGAIYSSNQVYSVVLGRFTNNTAQAFALSDGLGGAMAVYSGVGAVTNSYFEGNIAIGGAQTSPNTFQEASPAKGGAIFAWSLMAVHGSTFYDNKSAGGRNASTFNTKQGIGYGGAIYNEGTLGLINSTVATNAAMDYFPNNGGFGGAIYNTGSFGATNVTVSGNISGGGALFSEMGGFVLKNTLINHNSTVSASGVITDAGNNLSASETPVFTQASSSRNLGDLKLGPLGNWGGFTPTIPVLNQSPAINAGDDSTAPASDQRDRARAGTHVDVGAFESSAPFQVFGNVRGYFNGSTTATVGTESATVDSAGNFHFEVPGGIFTITVTGTNSVYSANPLTMPGSSDVAVSIAGFELGKFSTEKDFEAPGFTYAGRAGETWEYFVSNDLVTWRPVLTNTFTFDAPLSMPIPMESWGTNVFMKGIGR